MKKAYKKTLVGVAVVALAAAMAGLLYGSRLAAIGTAYAAKILCSGIFALAGAFAKYPMPSYI